MKGVAAAGLLLFGATAPPASSDRSRDENVLRNYTQRLLDAIAPGDKAPWEKLLAPTFLRMNEEGKVATKAQLLNELDPLPPGLNGRLRIDTFQVSFDHDLAVVAHEDQEELDYHGQTLRSRFRSFDTWRRTSAGWRLVGQHTAAVLKDPPAMAVSWRDSCEYAGTYRLAASIDITIHCTPTGLVASRNGRPDVPYRMEIPDLFFSPGQPQTRRIFLRNGHSGISGFVDRREGEDIHWNKIG